MAAQNTPTVTPPAPVAQPPAPAPQATPPADPPVEPPVAKKPEEVITLKTSDDVKKMLEKVRGEEKSKLRPQIEHYKSQSETLKAQNELLLQEQKLLQEQIGSKEDDKLSKTDKFDKQLQELRDQNVVLQKQQTALVEESQKQLRVMTLSTYKAQAIATAGGDLIAELVYGDSEAEIDAAILASKNRYREIVANAKQALKKDNANAPIPGPSGAPPTNVQNAPAGEELTVDMLEQMTPEQWAKERLNIRRQVNGTMMQFFKGK